MKMKLSFEEWLIKIADKDTQECPEGSEQLERYEEYLEVNENGN